MALLLALIVFLFAGLSFGTPSHGTGSVNPPTTVAPPSSAAPPSKVAPPSRVAPRAKDPCIGVYGKTARTGHRLPRACAPRLSPGRTP
jgi:hypothetical protein